eukprot:scaffold257479_cov14-Tisochrysis_lutea.AAC.1
MHAWLLPWQAASKYFLHTVDWRQSQNVNRIIYSWQKPGGLPDCLQNCSPSRLFRILSLAALKRTANNVRLCEEPNGTRPDVK